jgi:anaerobic magnesium-protoporphyrin IX monomethyl ester cyclase
MLVNPPWRKGDRRFGVRAGSRWPFTVSASNAKSLGYVPFPFFLAYAAAVLERLPSVTVSACDAIAEGLSDSEYLAKLRAFQPDLVVAETSTPSIDVDLFYVRKTKEHCKSELVYALAGPHVTIYWESVLRENPLVDLCFAGEYEWSLQELVQQLLRKAQDFDKIKGIAYRRQDGSIAMTTRREPGNVDELPFPAWHHFPMLNYRDYFCGLPGPMVNVIASRGCPFHCNFCMWPTVMYGGHLYRPRSPKSVVDEIEHLVSTYHFKTVYFDDDTFNIGKRRLLTIFDEIRRRNISVHLAMMARADLIDEETLVAAKAAGLYAVKYGVESGNQHVLDLSGKNLLLEDVKKSVSLTKKLGIKVHLTFSIGLLGETLQSVQDTLNLCLELKPESAQFSIATPFPGTEYYEQARSKNYLHAEEFADFDGCNACVIRTDELSRDDIISCYAMVLRKWRRTNISFHLRHLDLPKILRFLTRYLKHSTSI